MVLRFYRQISHRQEVCFNVEVSRELDADEREKLRWLLSETFEPERFREESFLNPAAGQVVELGPRLNFATAFSTNAVSICHACGLDAIKRVEKFRRYLLSGQENKAKFIEQNHDRMTECAYEQPPRSFAVDIIPEKVFAIPLIQFGPSALEKINKELGLGMDDWDIKFYYDLFVKDIGRDPTNVECWQLGQANSEHSRHWFFKGKLIIDGRAMNESLFDVVRSTWLANPHNSVIAFKDNSSAIRGNKIKTILPQAPSAASPFILVERLYHPTFTAETHNFPSGVAPVPGAETGTGGRIRDGHATGRGSLVVAGTAGFCAGNLNIPGYEIAGEEGGTGFVYPTNLAPPLKIMIGESFGAFDYGNKFGEPCIQGFTRTFGLRLPAGARREWIKPIMFTGGVGQIDDSHTGKIKPRPGMLIAQIGGPAYRIGLGGGAASSMFQGENKTELDFNAVQRADAEMGQKMNRVIRACVEMGDNNPILSIHDQGAGGPCNVLTELVDPAGGRVDIRKINVGDKTMSVLELWGAEYQERDGLLIDRQRITEFQAICQREKLNCEILGEVTGHGKIVLFDSQDNSTPVDLELAKILGQMPQKIFRFDRARNYLNPLKLRADLPIAEALKKVFSLPAVGSKGYLVRKVDRSVTGLIAQQQCCGPLQLPVADVSVIVQSHFNQSGAAIAIGEQPIKMLVDVKAGARMALAEALTNIVWAKITSLRDIKSSVNWAWAAKLPCEDAALYDAAVALRDLMLATGVAVDGGKDSLSMAAKVGFPAAPQGSQALCGTKADDVLIKAPGQMIVSAYVPVEDIAKIITPDIKKPGQSRLLFIDLGRGKNRLGGSALAQAFGQVGNISPDVESAEGLIDAFAAVQEMIDRNLFLAGHDRSDGGLITCLAEMAMSGNCGLEVKLESDKDALAQLFSEELGLVIEYEERHEAEIKNILQASEIKAKDFGRTLSDRQVIINQADKVILNIDTPTLLTWWEATSDRLEQEQMDKDLANEQARTYNRPGGPKYYLSFEPRNTLSELLSQTDKPNVAILREEGSNGDREMASAFYSAGFEPWDVTMTDLLNGRTSLDQFKGVAFVGGFAYADVLDSAKGWVGTIKFNPRLKEMFDGFRGRPDTFSFGICNGCQLLALLGWVPWPEIESIKQPRFIRNNSNKFESRWVNVKIQNSPAVMFKGMAGSSLGVWVAHGEGRLFCPDPAILADIQTKNLAPLVYIDDHGEQTEQYPFNPNGSPRGIAGLCSADGRHLALMPHPERAFLKWQWPYLPLEWKERLKASPWLKMFQNAREWCGRA